MYRLLIIDDEPYIVDWVYELFSQYKGLDLDIYKAHSGQEAIALLKRAKIDIVLSDIQMPEMNGLELLQVIRNNWPMCKVIFLTAHHEFDYAQIASKDGVAYLLKTESDEEIIRAVEKAATELDNALKQDELVKLATRQIEMALPFMQREFIQELLTGNDQPPVHQEQLDDLKIQLQAAEPVFIVIGRADDWYQARSVAERARQSAMFQAIAQQYFSPILNLACHQLSQHYLVWIMQPRANREEAANRAEQWLKALIYIQGSIESIQDQCRKNLDTTCSFVLDSRLVTWQNLARTCLSLTTMMNYGSANKPGSMQIRVKETEPAEENVDRYDYCFRQINSGLDKVRALETYFESGRKDDFFTLLSNQKQVLYPAVQKYPILLQEVLLTLSLMFVTYINRFPSLVELFADDLDYSVIANNCQGLSFDDGFQKFQAIAAKIFFHQKDDQDKSDRKLIIELQDYILKNLADDVSLIKLAELVYLNPTYLSRVYKQMTGTNLSEYIFNLRFNKAKALLKDSKKKVNEIATEVGFESAAYFIRSFKKTTGMTPQEFREKG
jgi:two-component system response regulator YesN